MLQMCRRLCFALRYFLKKRTTLMIFVYAEIIKTKEKTPCLFKDTFFPLINAGKFMHLDMKKRCPIKE